jgi:hypothetical protein
MTPRSQRNITPGKGDIYTFADCPDRVPGILYRSIIFCDYDPEQCVECRTLFRSDECPRGYAR